MYVCSGALTTLIFSSQFVCQESRVDASFDDIVTLTRIEEQYKNWEIKSGPQQSEGEACIFLSIDVAATTLEASVPAVAEHGLQYLGHTEPLPTLGSLSVVPICLINSQNLPTTTSTPFYCSSSAVSRVAACLVMVL